MRKVAVVAALVIFSACKWPWESNPTGPTQVTNVNVNIGNGAASPSPAPTASPAPGGACAISEVKVVMVGEEQCASGAPNTGDKMLRAGCTQFLTCTPKTKNSLGQTVDAPVSCTGSSPGEFKLTADTADTTLSDHDGNPFNVDATPGHPGAFTLSCTVLGTTGSNTFTVTP